MSFIIGLAAGFFGGLVGLGGGIVMIPLMTKFLKLNQHKAHGTSLAVLIFTGAVGAATYYAHGEIDVMAAGLLAVTAVVTARMGALYANTLPAWKLRRAFGWFLLFVSALFLIKPWLPHAGVETVQTMKIIVLLITGVFSGFLSGLMGVGGGTIMVPAMTLLAGYGQHMAQGISLLSMVPAGGVGAYTHWRLDNVEKKHLPGMIPGIIMGTLAGGALANYMPERELRIIFAAVLIWTGIKLVKTPSPACGRGQG